MEYFGGALITLLTVYVVNRLVHKQLSEKRGTVVRYSQSHVYRLANNIVFGESAARQKETQSRKYIEESHVRVVVSENKAYWIKDHQFFVADVVNGNVDNESTKQVDTMKMNDVELKKMMLIVETLREGNSDDRRGTGKP